MVLWIFMDYAFTWLCLAAFIPLFYIYLTWRFNELKAQGIDGPPPIPLFGNIITMFQQGIHDLDLGLHAKYGKLYSFFELRTPTLVVADPEIAKQVLVKDFSKFVNRREMYMRGELKLGTFDARDEMWRLVRSHLTPAFSSGKMRQMSNLIVHAADNLTAKLSEHAKNKSDFDAKKLAGNFTMEAIASTSFGMQLDTQNEENHPFVFYAKKFLEFSVFDYKILISAFVSWLAKIMEYFGASTMPADSIKFFKREVFEALEQRRNKKFDRPDFLHLMVEAERENEKLQKKMAAGDLATADFSKSRGLTSDEIFSQAILFLIAGYETTAATLSYFFYNLALHQECQEKLLKEIDHHLPKGMEPDYDSVAKLNYLEQCIEETLRLYPPLARVDRVASEDAEVGGVNVPKGMLVAIAITAIQKSPEYWTDPETFDPDRFTPEQKATRHPFCYLPFGQGPRNCVGMRLALMELKIVIVKLLQNFRIVRSPNTEVPLKRDIQSFFGKAKIELRVEFRD